MSQRFFFFPANWREVREETSLYLLYIEFTDEVMIRKLHIWMYSYTACVHMQAYTPFEFEPIFKCLLLGILAS